MDHFGIGVALRSAAQLYYQMARRTGRTTSLIDSVKDGDRIVFAERRERDRVERLLKERKVKVKCIAVEPSRRHEIFHSSTPEGRTIFDHSWVEQFYAMKLEEAAKEIDHLERESSGYGAAHRETARNFREFRIDGDPMIDFFLGEDK